VVVNASPWPLYPLETSALSTIQETDWVSLPVWSGAKNLAPTGVQIPNRTGRIDYAIPTHILMDSYLSIWIRIKYFTVGRFLWTCAQEGTLHGFELRQAKRVFADIRFLHYEPSDDSLIYSVQFLRSNHITVHVTLDPDFYVVTC